jgi:hypothetical protein
MILVAATQPIWHFRVKLAAGKVLREVRYFSTGHLGRSLHSSTVLPVELVTRITDMHPSSNCPKKVFSSPSPHNNSKLIGHHTRATCRIHHDA